MPQWPDHLVVNAVKPHRSYRSSCRSVGSNENSHKPSVVNYAFRYVRAEKKRFDGTTLEIVDAR